MKPINKRTIELTNVQRLQRCELIYMLFNQVGELVEQLSSDDSWTM